MGAIAEPHQRAILRAAQIRDVHGKPQANGGEGDRKGKGGCIRKHPVMEVIGRVARLFITRQIVSRLKGAVGVCRDPPLGCPSQVARPELEHDVLIVRLHGPLRLHLYRIRELQCDFITLPMILTQKVIMATCENL
jgi:hypothetical protein